MSGKCIQDTNLECIKKNFRKCLSKFKFRNFEDDDFAHKRPQMTLNELGTLTQTYRMECLYF